MARRRIGETMRVMDANTRGFILQALWERAETAAGELVLLAQKEAASQDQGTEIDVELLVASARGCVAAFEAWQQASRDIP